MPMSGYDLSHLHVKQWPALEQHNRHFRRFWAELQQMPGKVAGRRHQGLVPAGSSCATPAHGAG